MLFLGGGKACCKFLCISFRIIDCWEGWMIISIEHGTSKIWIASQIINSKHKGSDVITTSPGGHIK